MKPRKQPYGTANHCGATIERLRKEKDMRQGDLALICTAIHIYMQGAGKPWEGVAYKLIRDVLYEEKHGKPRNPNNDRILGAVIFIVLCFAVLGFITFIGTVITKIAGPLP